ncbi:MAG: hypothetical protein ABJO36_13640 [Litorimonas sp.]
MMRKVSEPPPRYWTKESIEILAGIFSLPSHDSMQDWAYEVADPKRLDEFFQALKLQENSDVQFTLMDIILQCLEESDVDLLNSELAGEISKYLKENFSTHIYQVWYWSAFDSEMKDCFRISPLIREVWDQETYI